MNKGIDIVVLWLDGNDTNWQKEKEKYFAKEPAPEKTDASTARYREWDLMRYWFRAVETYAPWVDQIHFVTCGHLPPWLNTAAPKLHIVKHQDYMPAEYLPTFSSHPIELNIHRIANLSDRFVYFNDDCFLTAPTKPEDFFKNGLPRDCLKENPIAFECKQQYNYILMNDILFANRHFERAAVRKKLGKKWFPVNAPKTLLRNLITLFLRHKRFFGLAVHHLPQPFLKETLEQVWASEPELLHQTSCHRFRHDGDISQISFKFWQLLSGNFVPVDMDRFGKAMNVTRDLDEICECIVQKRYKTICVNDGENVDFETAKRRLHQAFEKVLPNRSSFELDGGI